MPMRQTRSRAAGVAALLWPLLVFGLPATSSGQQGAVLRANIEEVSPSPRVQPPTPQTLGAVPEGFASLTLAPGFLVQMEVYGVPEMSAQIRVDVRGNLTIPLLGAIRVEGQAVAEAQDTIAKALADREILKSPQISLTILQYQARNVSVMGEVQIPGRVPLLAPEPLEDVLALAGGETTLAGNDIEIQGRSPGGEAVSNHIRFEQGQDSDVLRNVLIEPGDTVLVHRAGIVYVLGAVNRPGGYLMVNGGSLNVVQALSLAGGETLHASTHWAVIVRKKGEIFEQIKVPLGKMERGDAPPIALEINDALYVPVSGWKSLVINGSNVLSAAAAASIYAASSRP
jgi:polysaccharide export outer membrane protein